MAEHEIRSLSRCSTRVIRRAKKKGRKTSRMRLCCWDIRLAVSARRVLDDTMMDTYLARLELLSASGNWCPHQTTSSCALVDGFLGNVTLYCSSVPNSFCHMAFVSSWATTLWLGISSGRLIKDNTFLNYVWWGSIENEWMPNRAYFFVIIIRMKAIMIIETLSPLIICPC